MAITMGSGGMPLVVFACSPLKTILQYTSSRPSSPPPLTLSAGTMSAGMLRSPRTETVTFRCSASLRAGPLPCDPGASAKA